MGFGQTAEGDAEEVRSHGGNGNVFCIVHDQAVIDLVGEDDQLVLPRHIHDLLKDFLRVECAGRVVGVDDHDGLGAVCDLFLNVVNVRIPFGFFIADVVDHVPAGQRGAGGPQRIVGRGDQDLVAVVQQGGHAEVDQFADAVPGINVIYRYVRDVFQLGVLHDRFSCGEKSLGVGVALAFGQLFAHVIDDFVRRAEAERSRISDIKLQDLRAVFFHSGRFVYDRSSYIV